MKELQTLSVWTLLWTMIGLPFVILLIMYLRKIRRISRMATVLLTTLAIAGGFT